MINTVVRAPTVPGGADLALPAGLTAVAANTFAEFSAKQLLDALGARVTALSDGSLLVDSPRFASARLQQGDTLTITYTVTLTNDEHWTDSSVVYAELAERITELLLERGPLQTREMTQELSAFPVREIKRTARELGFHDAPRGRWSIPPDHPLLRRTTRRDIT